MRCFYKNALVSVSNKEGIVECVKALCESGTRVVSTGGTAKRLLNAGLPIVSVSDQTQFPEVMDGRVKTLHPHIFLPILARLNHKEDEKELQIRGLKHFDLVICNLYPFQDYCEKSDKEQMEWVDVGGPSILRASAKNFEKITTICSPEDYSLLKQATSLEQRKHLASKIFSHLSHYDNSISDYLKNHSSSAFTMKGHLVRKLRYGENPQQKAFWYQSHPWGLHHAKVIQGKELSFNNLLDLHSAISVIREFKTESCFVGIKHNNPCSVACASSLLEAVKKGLKADPLSIFGGVIACNQPIDDVVAELLSSVFLECMIAPSYSEKALQVLSKKKNLRLLSWESLLEKKQYTSVHTIDGGFLTQDADAVSIQWDDYRVEGKSPPPSVKKDLEMAWKVCAHLKSNAIGLVANGQTVGLGMGQVDRITAVELAFQRMKKYHPQLRCPVVMASDGFFPFDDSIQEAARMGIQWVIQPGGSLQDQKVLETARRLKVSIIYTGKRHFKH